MPKAVGSGSAKNQRQMLLAIADKKLVYGFYTVGQPHTIAFRGYEAGLIEKEVIKIEHLPMNTSEERIGLCVRVRNGDTIEILRVDVARSSLEVLAKKYHGSEKAMIAVISTVTVL